MKTFFSSTFIEEKALREVGIYHPIKLEYYKIENEKDLTDEKKLKFGIEVIKKIYKKEETKLEEKKVEEVTNDEKEIEKILEKLEKNGAVPVHLEDIIHDIMA